MSWTYADEPVVGGTAAQKRDAVRFLAQENQTAKQHVSDAEIAFLIATEANVYMAAAACAELVASRTGPVASKSVGDLSLTYGAAHYLALAQQLRARGMTHQLPTAGGLSVAGKTTLTTDTDWPKPAFRRGLHETPGQAPTTDEQTEA